MRVFVSDLHTTFGQQLATYLQDNEHEVVGSVATKTQLGVTKRRLQDHPSSDAPQARKDPVCLVSDKVSLSHLVQAADVVVTSLVRDTKHAMELLKIFEKPPADEEEGQGSGVVKRFIAITSVLTWSKNAPFAKDNTRGHSEDDFKTRKPARKYADLKTAETQVLSAQRVNMLETCLVASGLIYGGAQSNFALLFRDAWMYPDRDFRVPCLPGAAVPRGENLLPMISVYDLALLTFKLATVSAMPKNYIIATDKASQSTTLRDVCVGLSVLLGQTGKVRDVLTDDDVEDLLTNDEVDDATSGHGSITALQVHLCFDNPDEGSAMNQLVPAEEWKHVENGGLLGNLAFYVQDFITCLDLRPLRTVLLGPPRAGKTTLAQQLVKEYYLPHLTIESVVKDLLATTPSPTETHQQPGDEVLAEAKEASGDEPQSAAEDKQQTAKEDEDADVKRLRDEVLQVWQSEEETAKRVAALADTTVVALLRWKLTSATCRNQGYVLDGLPVTVAQATQIFELIKYADPTDEEGGDSGEGATEASDEKAQPSDADGQEDGDGGEGGTGRLAKSRSRAILDKLRPRKQIQVPNRVIMLNAPRTVLEKRAQELSEEEAIATRNTEAAFAARFAEFSSESEGLATFFETLSGAGGGVEVLELHLDNEDSYRDGKLLREPVTAYMEQGGQGKPNNFHPTREEIKQMEREFAIKKEQEEARQRQLEQEQDERDATEQQTRAAADRARLEVIQREEAELLETRAKPLRTYLMDTVLPALTEGMLEVVKVQPEDPIDYLAEFLFQKGRAMEEQANASY